MDRADLLVDFHADPRVIEILAPVTTATIQDLHDAIREYEAALVDGMEYDHLINASGKDQLRDGVYVGITLSLQNAVIKFQDRPGPTFVTCVIEGGNLVAVDALRTPMDPVAPSSFVTVIISQSVSPTLVVYNEDLALVLNRLTEERAENLDLVDAAVTSRAAPGDAMALEGAERLAVADAVLDRDMGAGTDTGSSHVRTVRQALRALRNKVVRSLTGRKITVYKEDDTTPDWEATVTDDADAPPMTSWDPE